MLSDNLLILFYNRFNKLKFSRFQPMILDQTDRSNRKFSSHIIRSFSFPQI